MIKEGDIKVGRSAYNEQSGSVERVLAMEFKDRIMSPGIPTMF